MQKEQNIQETRKEREAHRVSLSPSPPLFLQ